MKRVFISMLILLACLLNQCFAQADRTMQVILVNNLFGCSTKEDFSKIELYADQGDHKAVQMAIKRGVAFGTVTFFKKGEIVYRVYKGPTIVRVRRQGDTQEYWTRGASVSDY